MIARKRTKSRKDERYNPLSCTEISFKRIREKKEIKDKSWK